LDSQGSAPLWKAVRSSKLKSVRLLLEAGCDPNIADQKQGWTPLHCNAFCNREPDSLEIARQLLDHGANVNTVDSAYGETPLHYAVRVAKSAKLVELLLESGAEVNAL